MSDTVIVGIAAACLIVGYWIGRSRPYATTSHRAWLRGIAFPVSKKDAKWGYLWLALHPTKALNAWRRRNQPRRQPAPAPVLLRTRPLSPTEQPRDESETP